MFYQNYRPYLLINTPKPPSKEGIIEGSQKGNRKDLEDLEKSIQRYIRVRHKRKATPEASSSLGAAASWRTARDPSLAGDFVTMIDYASPSFMG